MTEEEIRTRWESERSLYRALGDYVTYTIRRKIQESYDDIHSFLKIDPVPRLKDVNSLLEKAFYREKNYVDPYGEITDKVGVRFVVLTKSDIEILRKIIENIPQWTAELSRDFQEEQQEKPRVFDYESVHYLVRLTNSVTFNEVSIPPNIPCEIQLRSLLQHACSELTHDAIYKAKVKVTPAAERACAKAIALSDATDDFFMKTFEELDTLSQKKRNFLRKLNDIYKEFIGNEAQNTRITDVIYNALEEIIEDDALQKIEASVESIKWLVSSICERRNRYLIYNDSIILLVYYLLRTKKETLREKWPLLSQEITRLANDIGEALE